MHEFIIIKFSKGRMVNSHIRKREKVRRKKFQTGTVNESGKTKGN